MLNSRLHDYTKLKFSKNNDNLNVIPHISHMVSILYFVPAIYL